MDSGERELDIAVIGMAGRFPRAPNIAAYWDNLLRGRDCIQSFTQEELAEHGVPEAERRHPRYVPRSGYLAEVDKFDPSFFGFSQREAELTDPQHRLLLEIACAALEDGGYGGSFDGRIGCYAAAGMSLYAGPRMNSYLTHNLLSNRALLDAIIAPTITVANREDYLATRIAYKLNLKGPAVNVQTACSSGLVAVHIACQALLNGECDMALAGAAAIHAPPKAGYVFEEGGILSPDGVCRPFDSEASGTVGGNGAGMVLLKRAVDARADRDFVYAVVRGSSINNDGYDKVSYLAPSIAGQTDVVRQALTMAGVHPDDIDYVEAHGTGTRLGDPVEIASLTEAYRALGGRQRQRTLVGSVKGNIGHLDTAAGIASFIKAVLMLHHRTWVPTINHRAPSAALDLANTPFAVCTDTQSCRTQSGEAARAGVSAFGAGGTNAHVVLEAAGQGPRAAVTAGYQVLTLSARSEAALGRNAESLLAYLARDSNAQIHDVCFTSRVGRAQMDHRLAVIGKDRNELVAALGAATTGAPARGLHRSGDRGASRPRVGFLFSGQGQLRRGVAAPLAHLPAFRAGLASCEEALRAVLPERSPLRELSLTSLLIEPGEDDILRRAALAQPATFALEYALLTLWRAAAVEPHVVLGHSLGEYAAACAAGILDLRTALELVVHRGSLMEERCTEEGAMLVAFAAPEAVAPHLEGDPRLSVACYNSPNNTAISGAAAAISALRERLTAARLPHAPLAVSHAFHSHLMEPMLDPFRDVLARLRCAKPKRLFVSTLTGAAASQLLDSRYWADQVREPVRFTEAVRRASEHADLFIELGPAGVLSALVRQTLEPGERSAMPSLASGGAELLAAAAELHVRGHSVLWESLGVSAGFRTPIPSYSFERQTCWISPPTSRDAVAEDTLTSPAACTRARCLTLDLDAVAAPAPTGSLSGRALLLLGPDGPLRDGMASALVAARASVTVETHLRDDLRAGLPWDDIVDLRALSAHSDRELGAETFAAQDIARVLVEQRFAGRCWFVTRGATQVPLGPAMQPSIGCSGLWGLARTLRAEHPEVSWHCADLLCEDALTAVPAMVAELKTPGDVEIVLADGRRLGPVLTVLQDRSFEPLVLSAGATYLISGGLGGIGLALAERLIERGARRLVLVGRSAPSPETSARLAELRSTGVAIDVAAVDISEREAVARLLSDVQRDGAELRGIVHAAGVLDDGVFMRQTAESLRRVIRPKVSGAIHLDELSLAAPLDFFVMISSVAALCGSPGQANYAAANAALRAVATGRRANARVATCLYYGPWAEVGMAAQHAARHRRIGALPKQLAVDAFELAISRDIDELVILPDAAGWGTARRISMIDQARQVWGLRGSSGRPHRREELLSTPPRLRRDKLARYLAETVGQLVASGTEGVALDVSFHELGMESLTGLQLKRLLEAELEIALPATLIYEFSTVSQLCDHLLERLMALPVTRQEPPPLGCASLQRRASGSITEVALDSLNETQLLELLRHELTATRAGLT